MTRGDINVEIFFGEMLTNVELYLNDEMLKNIEFLQ